MNSETKIMRGWRLKISLLMAIITPTIAVVGSFYSIKLDARDRDAAMSQRVSALELNTQKQFADKDELKEIRKDIHSLDDKVTGIQDLLLRTHR